MTAGCGTVGNWELAKEPTDLQNEVLGIALVAKSVSHVRSMKWALSGVGPQVLSTIPSRMLLIELRWIS